MCVRGDLSICPELGPPAVCQLREELVHCCVRGHRPQGAATRVLTMGVGGVGGGGELLPTATGTFGSISTSPHPLNCISFARHLHYIC